MFTEQDAERKKRSDCPYGVDCRDAHCQRWHDYGLAFTQPNGRPLHENNIAGHDFPHVVKRAGVRRIRLYDLRHINASLLAPYTPLKVISEHLGHSSVAVTGDIYTHVLPGMQGEAIRALEARLFSTPNLHLSERSGSDRNR